MSEHFDPYYTWLGIPPEEQPPDHYRLLGIRRFENNPEVISNATDQRMAHIRSFQTGKRAEFSQHVLTELSKASGCLLSPDKKGAYDRELRQKDAPKLAKSSGNVLVGKPLGAHQSGPIPVGASTPSATAGPQAPHQSGVGLPVARGPMPAGLTPVPSYPVPVQPHPNGAPPASAPQPAAQYAPGAAPMPIIKTTPDGVTPSLMPRSKGVNPLVIGAIGCGAVLLLGILGITAAVVGGRMMFASSDTVAKKPDSKPTNEKEKPPPKVELPVNPDPGRIGPLRPPVVVPERTSPMPSIAPKPFEARPSSSLAKVTLTADSGAVSAAAKGFALQFDGTSHVELNNTRELAAWSKPGTAEVWIRWGAGSRVQDQTFMGTLWNEKTKDPRQRTAIDGWALGTHIYGSRVMMSHFYAGSSGRIVEQDRFGDPAIKPDLAWHHVAYAHDNTGLDIFVDGKLQRLGRNPSWPPASDDPLGNLFLGVPKKSGGTRKMQFEGAICAFRMSAKKRYTRDFDPPLQFDKDADTVALLDFSQGSGEQISDVSGNNHFGAINGAQWVPLIGGPGKSVSSTSGELSLVVGKSIDLLEGVDAKLHIVKGTFEKDAEGWKTSGGKGGEVYEAMVLPTSPPEEYVLETVVTLLGDSNGIIQGLVAGGKQCSITVDGFGTERGGMRTALEMIDHHRPHDGPRYPCELPGSLLTKDRKAILSYIVLKDRIVMQRDGQTVLDWKDGLNRVTLFPLFDVRNPGSLFWGTWQTKLRLEKCTLTPILAVNGAPTQLALASNPPTVRPKPSDPTEDPTPPIGVRPPNLGDLLKPKSVVVERRPAPASAELEAAKKDVEGAFKQGLSKAVKPLEKIKVAEEMLAAAKDEKTPAIRYVLLEQARTLKLEAGDIASAFDVVDRLIADYEVDPWQIKVAALKKGSEAANNTEERRRVADMALKVGEAAISAGNFDAAGEAAVVAVSAAKSAENKLKTAASKLKSTVDAVKKQIETAQAASEKLKTAPDDPQANAEWGRYLCLIKREWKEGLPYLKKGNDEGLKAAAELDLEAPTDWQKQADLGDKWYGAGEKVAVGREKDSLNLRARSNFNAALKEVPQGIKKQLLESKLAKIAEVLPKEEAIAGSSPVEGGLPGMIGRIMVNNRDSGLIVKYEPGDQFTSGRIRDLLTLHKVVTPNNAALMIQLEGRVHISAPTTVTLKQTGGTFGGGAGILSFNNSQVSTVGGKEPSEATKSVFLRKEGDYTLVWGLRGLDIGTCQLEITNDDSRGDAPFVFYNGDLEKAVRAVAKTTAEISLKK